MNISPSTLSVTPDKTKLQNSRRASLIFMAINGLSVPVYAFLASQTKGWQLWALVAITFFLTLAGWAGVLLTNREKPAAAMTLLIIATVIGGLASSLLVAGLGFLIAGIIVIVSLVLAAQSLSRHVLNRVLMFGGLAGLAAMAINLLGEPIQTKIPALQNTVPLLAVLAVGAFGWIVIRQFAAYPFSTKLLLLFLVVVLLAVAAVTMTALWMLRNPSISQTAERSLLLISLVVSMAAAFVSLVVAQFLTKPVGDLTKIANEFASGNLNVHAFVDTNDEISELASTFNHMAVQLRETLSGLEQRVAARTKDLATVAEVATVTSTILDVHRLLQEVVDLTKERFNLYHSHIYLLDEKGENLILTAGAGEPGRIMAAEKRSIPLSLEQSLVARAARERKGVIVNDVTQAPDFLPNPLLPNTRSELAVPMLIGDTLVGVFDIQSDQAGRFTDSDVNIQTTLAAQVAASVQNARSYERSKEQAELEALVNIIGERIQRATTLEDTLQTAIREVAVALGAARVSATIGGGGRDFESRPNN